MTTTSPPEQGQLVQVRSRPWVVNVVKPSNLPTPAMQSPVGGTQNLLTLSSVEDDGLGEELQVVWEIEPGAKIIEKVALPDATGFDAPREARCLSGRRPLGGRIDRRREEHPVPVPQRHRDRRLPA